MRKSIAIFTIWILAIFISSCTKKDTILNMIQAPHGQVIDDQQTGYRLILEEPNDVVIWFTDRPIRKGGHIQIRDFLRDWDEGKNSFKQDPPNAVLIIDDSEPVAVELILAKWNENRAIFELKSLKGQEHKIADKKGPVSLFVDNFRVVGGR